MKEYKLLKPQLTTNSYNEQIPEWEDNGTVLMFLSLNSHSNSTEQGIGVNQCQWIGITQNSSVEIGDRVDNYVVEFIVEGRDRYLYLRDYGRNNG
jgi:hypothetical protein